MPAPGSSPAFLQFSVGGFALRFEADDFPDGARGRYEPFAAAQTAEQTADMVVRVTWTGAEYSHAQEPLAEEHGERLVLSRLSARCELLPDAGTGCAEVARSVMALDGLARMIFAELLTRRDGFLVHAAGLSIRASEGGPAVLFPGVSGKGKSTLSEKAGHARALSDELTAVHVPVDSRGATISGTPFWGAMLEAGLNRTHELTAVCFLEPDSGPALAPCSRADFFRRLLPCMMRFSRSAQEARRSARLATRLMECVPGFVLRTRRDTSFETVLRMMEEGAAGRATPRA